MAIQPLASTLSLFGFSILPFWLELEALQNRLKGSGICEHSPTMADASGLSHGQPGQAGRPRLLTSGCRMMYEEKLVFSSWYLVFSL
jgi:hypothetical protein